MTHFSWIRFLISNFENGVRVENSKRNFNDNFQGWRNIYPRIEEDSTTKREQMAIFLWGTSWCEGFATSVWIWESYYRCIEGRNTESPFIILFSHSPSQFWHCKSPGGSFFQILWIKTMVLQVETLSKKIQNSTRSLFIDILNLMTFCFHLV